MRAEGDGGILFYIIIAIVGIILSFLQNKTRPKQPMNTEPSQQDPIDTWEELMDWEEPSPVLREKDKATTHPKPSQAELISKPFEEGKSVFSDTPLNEKMYNYQYNYESLLENNSIDYIKETEIKSVKEENEPEATIKFSLKDAIIYSEIINKKYI